MVSSWSRWSAWLVLFPALVMVGAVACADMRRVAVSTVQGIPSVTAATVAPSCCLAVPRELWEGQREFFTSLQRQFPECSTGPTGGSSQALEWVRSGRSKLAIVSGQRPVEGAELIREVPFAVVAHVASPLDDVPLAWLRDAFLRGGWHTLVVSEDGIATREILGIADLAPGVLRVSSWEEVKRVVAKETTALALLPWSVVDFHVRALAIDGQRIAPGRWEDYPFKRRWWLVGCRDHYPEVCQALQEGLAYEPGALVSLVAVGDVMLGRGVGVRIGANSPFYPFVSTQELTGEAHVAFANLECPLTSRGVPQVGIALCARPEVAEGLSYAGFDVLSLANNHSADCGELGLLDTLDRLGENGIAGVGVGRNAREVHRPVIVEAEGMRIAFLAYNHIQPRYAGTGEAVYGPAWLEPAAVCDDVKRARDQADFVVVSFHWGNEYTLVPDAFQQEVARRVVESGADLVVGHHPHVAQGVAFLDGGFVAYSLGNFVFDQPFSVETAQGLMLYSLLEDGALKQVRLIPVQIDDGRPQVLPPSEARAVLADVFQATESLGGLPRGSQLPSGRTGGSAHLQVDWVTELREPVNALQVSDLDRDGMSEVLVGTGWPSGWGGVYALNSDGSIRWVLETEEQVNSLRSADLDGDGMAEVLVAVGELDRPGSVYALDSHGQVEWKFGLEASALAVAVGDVGGGGGWEVAAGEWGSFGETVYLLGQEGSLRWKRRTDRSVHSVHVADLDGDGRGEVVAGADDLYLFGSDGSLMWRYQASAYVNGLGVGDLSGDGFQQIVAITAYPDPCVFALSVRGALSWRYEVHGSPEAVLLGDVDHDGKAEAVVGCLDGTVCLLNGEGGLRREWQVGGSINDLALADGKRGEVTQVVVGTGEYPSLGGIYVLDAVTGSELASYEGIPWVTALDVWDMDGDGRHEIVAATGSGDVRLLTWTME